MAGNNPFSPTFGTSPPVLAGRDDILESLDEAFETGPTHPDYTVLLSGVRGTGKTAILNAAEDMVREQGWLMIAEQGSPSGLTERAESRIGHLVVAPTWNGLSSTDRRFLTAMTADTGNSALAAVAQRMGVAVNYAHVYRRRLERVGMIVTAAPNAIAFAYPAAQAWVSERTDQHSAH